MHELIQWNSIWSNFIELKLGSMQYEIVATSTLNTNTAKLDHVNYDQIKESYR